jgi:hypothetical protein
MPSSSTFATRRKCGKIKPQINTTGKEIDQIVYALYQLTEKEIKIVGDIS